MSDNQIVQKPRCKVCHQSRYVEWQGVIKLDSMKITNTYTCHFCGEGFTDIGCNDE